MHYAIFVNDDTHEIWVVLIDLDNATICREHGHKCVQFEAVAHLLAEHGILAQLRGNDHARSP